MKGSVRTQEKCPVCGGAFTLQIVQNNPGLYCEAGHRTVPRRFYLDCRMFRRHVPRDSEKPPAVGYVFRDERGILLDSYFAAARMLESIRHDYDKDPTKFNALKWSTIGTRSRRFKDVWEKYEETVYRSGARVTHTHTELFGRLHILPVLGDVLLGKDDSMELTPGELRRLDAALQEKRLSPQTRISIFAAVRACLSYAKDEKLIGTDDIPKFPKVARSPLKKKYWMTPEVHAQIRDLHTHRVRLLLDVLFETGMRPGEGCGLQKDDILPEGKIYIQRALDYKRRVGPPKNGKPRYVDISDDLHKALMALPALGEAYLFTTGNGIPYNTGTLSKMYRGHADAAGYPQLSLYSLRHSTASRIAADVREKSELAASAALGNGQRMAADHYIHDGSQLVEFRRREV